MEKYNIALNKDINKHYIDAVAYYQASVDENELNVDAYLNLAFLYWNFQDFGFFTYYNIPESLRAIGYIKYNEILEKGIKQFPNNVELQFWKKYFQHIFFGKEFLEQECEQLIEKYTDIKSIVPYFFLYLFNKKKYVEEKGKLLYQCSEQPTAKNIYIMSILENR